MELIMLTQNKIWNPLGKRELSKEIPFDEL